MESAPPSTPPRQSPGSVQHITLSPSASTSGNIFVSGGNVIVGGAGVGAGLGGAADALPTAATRQGASAAVEAANASAPNIEVAVPLPPVSEPKSASGFGGVAAGVAPAPRGASVPVYGAKEVAGYILKGKTQDACMENAMNLFKKSMSGLIHIDEAGKEVLGAMFQPQAPASPPRAVGYTATSLFPNHPPDLTMLGAATLKLPNSTPPRAMVQAASYDGNSAAPASRDAAGEGVGGFHSGIAAAERSPSDLPDLGLLMDSWGAQDVQQDFPGFASEGGLSDADALAMLDDVHKCGGASAFLNDIRLLAWVKKSRGTHSASYTNFKIKKGLAEILNQGVSNSLQLVMVRALLIAEQGAQVHFNPNSFRNVKTGFIQSCVTACKLNEDLKRLRDSAKTVTEKQKGDDEAVREVLLELECVWQKLGFGNAHDREVLTARAVALEVGAKYSSGVASTSEEGHSERPASRAIREPKRAKDHSNKSHAQKIRDAEVLAAGRRDDADSQRSTASSGPQGPASSATLPMQPRTSGTPPAANGVIGVPRGVVANASGVDASDDPHVVNDNRRSCAPVAGVENMPTKSAAKLQAKPSVGYLNRAPLGRSNIAKTGAVGRIYAAHQPYDEELARKAQNYKC